MSIQESRVADVTAKWELAERMAGRANAPKQALGSLFKGVMTELAQQAGTTFDASLVERVWNKVSPERLELIKAHLLSEFCDKILGSFKENEAQAMLDEHKESGSVTQSKYTTQIRTASQAHFEQIIDSVMVKANSMTDGLVPEVFEFLRGEGIEFSDSASTT